MHLRLFSLLLLFAASLRATAASPTQTALTDKTFSFSSNDTKLCLKCHGMPNFAYRDSSSLLMKKLDVSPSRFQSSVHGKLACQQCHANITRYPHALETPRATVGCGDDCHAVDANGKKYSHEKTFGEFRASVHGKSLSDSKSDAPTCTTCHGNANPHEIVKATKAMSVSARMNLCITCHDNEALMHKNKVDAEAVSSYRRSFHFKAIKFGETNTAVCQDCHTVHGILPKDSSRSSIAPTNIASTCGQEKCHPGAQMNFAMSGANHLDLRINREPALWVEEKLFLLLTAGTMAMLLIGIVLDIQKKFGWSAIARRSFVGMSNASARMRFESIRSLRFLKRILFD